ncbi:MAG: hypothetical protein CMF46_05140 [Legionellales bacterium]|nr:hypothetical protein [Legionellales bacterium]|tara:strand:- start:686 stop:2083 length:1398 start_codon:yes stop_codon:yes gene_type:complete
MPVTKCCARCNFFYSGPSEEGLAKLQKDDWPTHRRKCKLYAQIKQLIEPNETASVQTASFKILALFTKHSYEKSSATLDYVTDSFNIFVQTFDFIKESRGRNSKQFISTKATLEDWLRDLGNLNVQIRQKGYKDIEIEYINRRAILEKISNSNIVLSELVMMAQSFCIGGMLNKKNKEKTVELIDKKFSEREKLDYISKIHDERASSHHIAAPLLQKMRENSLFSDPDKIDSIKLGVEVMQRKEFVVAMKDEVQSLINLSFLLEEDERYYNGLIKRFKEFMTDQTEPGLKVNPNLHPCFKKEYSQARLHIFAANKSYPIYAAMANKALEQQSIDGIERTPEALATDILYTSLASDCQQKMMSLEAELKQKMSPYLNDIDKLQHICNAKINKIERLREHAISDGDRALAARIDSKLKLVRRDQAQLITEEEISPLQSVSDDMKDLNTENKKAAAQTNKSTSRVKRK